MHINKLNTELLKNIIVLYVEDEQTIREEVTSFCKKFIPNFFAAKDADEGIKLYSDIKPDLIVTDIRMPNKSGIEMIKELNCDIPVVLTTAYSDVSYFLEAIELNITKFFSRRGESNLVLMPQKYAAFCGRTRY